MTYGTLAASTGVGLEVVGELTDVEVAEGGRPRRQSRCALGPRGATGSRVAGNVRRSRLGHHAGEHEQFVDNRAVKPNLPEALRPAYR